MALRRNFVALRDVPDIPRREELVLDMHGAKMAAKRQCTNFKGCTVCIRHNTEDIITNNNAAPQARNAISSFAPPHQSDDFEEEEELNPCILRSC